MKIFMVWASMAPLRVARSEVTLVLVYTGVGVLGSAWEVAHSFPLDSVSLSRLISDPAPHPPLFCSEGPRPLTPGQLHLLFHLLPRL